MIINNPFYPHPHVRFSFGGNGDATIVTGAKEVEVPDNCDCLIEPIPYGRSDAPALCQGRMWSPAWGVLDLEDYEAKRQLEKEKFQMKLEQERVAKKAAKEARCRAKIEKTKVVANNPSKEEVVNGKDIREVCSQKLELTEMEMGPELEL